MSNVVHAYSLLLQIWTQISIIKLRMRQNASTIVNRKKNAFRTQIRKEWLGDYFKKQRTQLRQQSKNQETLLQSHTQQIQMLLKKIPNSLEKLYDYLNYNQLYESLTKYLDQLVDSIRQLKTTQFYFYMCILSEMVHANKGNQKIVFHIIKSSLTPLLHNAVRILKDNKILKATIIKQIIQYLTFVQNRFDIINQIQMEIIASLLVEFIELFIYSGEKSLNNQYSLALQVINNVIITSLPQQDKQNIAEKHLIELQQKKIKFLHLMFGNNFCIKSLIKNTMNRQNMYPISMYTLKMLVNFTHFTSQIDYYNLMFQNHITEMIGYIFNLTINEAQQILVIRLVNNLLVTNLQITAVKIQNIYLSNIIKLFFKQPQSGIICKQILFLFVNLINFVAQYQHCIRYLISLNVCQILFYALSIDYQDDTLVQQTMIAFYPLLQVSPTQISMKMRQNWANFQKLSDTCNNDLTQFIDFLSFKLYGQEEPKPLQHQI